MHKEYYNYEDYLNHQKEKTLDPIKREKWFREEWVLKLNYFERKFKEVLERYPVIKNGKAIGLGARTGQEIQAMVNLGFDAIGIDLVSCEPLVIEGDIHDIPFNEDRFDFAYTNIYDHALYPEKFLTEIRRVLKPNGHCLVHLWVGMETDDYGVHDIEDSKEILDYFQKDEILINTAMSTNEEIVMNWKVLIKICKV